MMAKSAREIAMEALAQTPEERARAEAEDRRQEEARTERQRREEQSKTMVALASSEIMRVLGVTTLEWEVVEKAPHLAVLRDPSDKAHHKLALSVRDHGDHGLEIRYAPYEGYGQTQLGAHPPCKNWVSGPIIKDAESLGHALKAHDDEQQRYYESMPAHLP